MYRFAKAGLVVLAICAALVAPSPGQAGNWSGIETGPVGAIHVSRGDNYAIRVHLTDGRAMCTALADRPDVANWAFLNENDSNYKTYVAMLMMAKATGATVTIYSVAEPYSTTGTFCRIGYVVVQ